MKSIPPLLAVVGLFAFASRHGVAETAPQFVVGKPPAELKLDPFYEKYVDAGGLPVVGSKQAADEALVEAAQIIGHMLEKRPDLVKALADGNVRVAVMSEDEVTTDVPDHSRLKPKDYWDRRARGLGGTSRIPTTSCAEENLLGYDSDRYNGENILIHEFAHTVHEVGMKAIDKEFDDRLKKLYDDALLNGLWQKTYSATNHKEYWAEGVQSYFDCNLRAAEPDGVHNHVRTREQLQKYDPELAKLVDEVFAGNTWRWAPTGAHAKKWQDD
jgi:alpha-glucosidase